MRRKFILAANSHIRLPVCENILNREFQAGRSGEKWGPDIACPVFGDGLFQPEGSKGNVSLINDKNHE
jgi:hypothetical protein